MNSKDRQEVMNMFNRLIKPIEKTTRELARKGYGPHNMPPPKVEKMRSIADILRDKLRERKKND